MDHLDPVAAALAAQAFQMLQQPHRVFQAGGIVKLADQRLAVHQQHGALTWRVVAGRLETSPKAASRVSVRISEVLPVLVWPTTATISGGRPPAVFAAMLIPLPPSAPKIARAGHPADGGQPAHPEAAPGSGISGPTAVSSTRPISASSRPCNSSSMAKSAAASMAGPRSGNSEADGPSAPGVCLAPLRFGISAVSAAPSPAQAGSEAMATGATSPAAATQARAPAAAPAASQRGSRRRRAGSSSDHPLGGALQALRRVRQVEGGNLQQGAPAAAGTLRFPQAGDGAVQLAAGRRVRLARPAGGVRNDQVERCTQVARGRGRRRPAAQQAG